MVLYPLTDMPSYLLAGPNRLRTGAFEISRQCFKFVPKFLGYDFMKIHAHYFDPPTTGAGCGGRVFHILATRSATPSLLFLSSTDGLMPQLTASQPAVT